MKIAVVAVILALFIGTAFSGPALVFGQNDVLVDIPEVRGPFTLTAVHDFATGRNAFAYAGHTVPPVIRVSPGGVITVRYVNDLPRQSDEECATGPCTNITNLHFHGMHVSPERPQDDVLMTISKPGEVLNYKVAVPSYSPPGLYWYHTHPHGESARQALDGMSGAIVVEGIDRYYPELRRMRERVLILRDEDLAHVDEATRQQILQQVEVPSSRCGTSVEQKVDRIFTINGQVRPRIPVDAGAREFWRIVNASPDRYADLQVSGEQVEVVALDGMPLSYHNRFRGVRKADHVLLAPAARLEAIVVGPPQGSRSTFSTRCVDTGPDGDPNPAMLIADLVTAAHSDSPAHRVASTPGPAVYKETSAKRIEALEDSPPDFTVVFTEDSNGFYINGRKFAMDAAPMLRVKVGSMHHWRVINQSKELHPFHIHQVHFLAYAQDGVRSQPSEWLDTVNVPYGGGTIDLIMDFTDPIIRGMSVFHCHLLSHEDKGMMAKILFQ